MKIRIFDRYAHLAAEAAGQTSAIHPDLTVLISLHQPGCQASNFVSFVTGILCLACFNEFIKRNIKGDFDEKKA